MKRPRKKRRYRIRKGIDRDKKEKKETEKKRKHNNKSFF